jgi:hypothetical protein
VPYQSGGGKRNNVQIGVGRSLWSGAAPPPIPERALDGIPGCLAWLTLLFSVASALAFPRVVLTMAAFLGAYSTLRFLLAGIANMTGMRRIREWEQIDWKAKYDAEHAGNPDALPWDAVKHLVIVPNYTEAPSILRRTLENLASQYEAKARMTVVLAMEAAEQGAAAKAEALIAEFGHRFEHIMYTIHPRGLPGEMIGKSSNQAWAARQAKRRMVDELGCDINHIVISTMDADTMWHPRYFFALTYLFASSPQRYARTWQSPIRYHGNIWDITPPMRLVNAYAGAFELAYLAASWWQAIPISSYSYSLRLLDASGYWDTDVIAEDAHMYIKAFFSSNAELELEPVFLPFLATATTGETIWEVIKLRYGQSLRHAWGSKEVGYIIARMMEHPEISTGRSLKLLIRVAHDILLAGAGWMILTIGSQLPILFNPGLVPPLSQLTQDPIYAVLILSAAAVVVLGIVFWAQDVASRPPRTQPITLRERLLTLVSFPLLPVLTLIFVALPVMHAQTRLLLGGSLQYQVARKI